MKKRTVCILAVLLLFIVIAVGIYHVTRPPAVEELVIVGLPETVEYGQQIQLTAVGYDKDGNVVPPEVMAQLELHWLTSPELFKSEIDQNGLLTITSEADCNVQVGSRVLDLYSRHYTVRVVPRGE